MFGTGTLLLDFLADMAKRYTRNEMPRARPSLFLLSEVYFIFLVHILSRMTYIEPLLLHNRTDSVVVSAGAMPDPR
jgi:hypothetical protein